MTIIGIDIGRCNTSAAIFVSNYRVKQLDLEEHENVTLTQIILTNPQIKYLEGKKSPSYSQLCHLEHSCGEIKIGKYLKAIDEDKEEKFLYFKTDPANFNKHYVTPEGIPKNITYGQIMACFVYALIKNIFKYNGYDISEQRNAISLMLGWPAYFKSTDNNAKKQYAELIKNATGVKEVLVESEARAAVFNSMNNSKTIRIIPSCMGILLFDFSAFSVSCTYIYLGKIRFQFSWDLGASRIEQEMINYCLREIIKENSNFHASNRSLKMNFDMFKRLKEIYYNGEYGVDGLCTFCSLMDKEGKLEDVLIRVNDDFMEKITDKALFSININDEIIIGSWRSFCADIMLKAKEKIEKNSETVSMVILTGGASKMGFIKEICQEIFGKPVYLEQNPQFVISKGLAWLSKYSML